MPGLRTGSWRRPDPTAPRRGTGFRRRPVACAERVREEARSARSEGKDGKGDGASAGAAWSCDFVAPRPPSRSSHRVFRGFIAGARVETRLKHRLVGLLEKPVLEPLKKPSQTSPRINSTPSISWISSSPCSTPGMG